MKKVESMDEYIKGVLSYARQFEYHQQKKTAEFFYDLADYLKSLPTVEAKPVVHAKWDRGVLHKYPMCTNCQLESKDESDFCPNCGADMREKVNL